MDIQRPSQAGRKKRRRILIGAGVVLLLAVITLGLSRLQPAAPSVERGTVWIDTVKRGPMLRQVRGAGTLVPEEIQWVPAATEGRVERIFVQPGAAVTPQTVLLRLSNPELELAVVDAGAAGKAGEAERANL